MGRWWGEELFHNGRSKKEALKDLAQNIGDGLMRVEGTQ